MSFLFLRLLQHEVDRLGIDFRFNIIQDRQDHPKFTIILDGVPEEVIEIVIDRYVYHCPRYIVMHAKPKFDPETFENCGYKVRINNPIL